MVAKRKTKRSKRSKTRHVQFLNVGDIRPSPENDKIYRPVDPADPDIVALAESMRKNGVLEELVVTADGYTISGQSAPGSFPPHLQPICTETTE